MKNFFDFTEKKYLVTGASSGIGRSTAIELSRQGARVVLLARDESRLNETLSQMEGTGHCIFSQDLARSDALADLFKTITQDGKGIDGVVHSAGAATILPLSLLDRTSMDACMSVNLYSFVELVKQASKKKFRAEKMSIVAISSISALQPKKCQTIYAASKSALNVAVQSLAMELADKGIRINSICVGGVDTQMARDFDRAMPDAASRPQVLGTLQPEQIAHSVLYLLSDASSSMTGRVLFADGGMI